MARRLYPLSTLAVAGAFVLAACSAPPAPPAAPAPGPGPAAPAVAQTWAFPGGQWQLAGRDGACALTLQGEVNEGAVRRGYPALQAMADAGCAARTLSVQTRGGTVGSAVTLGAMVRNRGLDTTLAPGAWCDTPCLLVLAAGVQRRVPEQPPPAQVAFTPLPPDADFGHQRCATELSRAQQLTLARYLRAMLPTDTADTVYQRLASADCREPVTWSPLQALAAGLATALR